MSYYLTSKEIREKVADYRKLLEKRLHPSEMVYRELMSRLQSLYNHGIAVKPESWAIRVRSEEVLREVFPLPPPKDEDWPVPNKVSTDFGELRVVIDGAVSKWFIRLEYIGGA